MSSVAPSSQGDAPAVRASEFPVAGLPAGAAHAQWMNLVTTAPAPQLKHCKILIAAADRAKGRALAEILRRESYTVQDVNSGQAALDVYAQFEPDLVLFDVELPGVHVFE